MELKQSIENRHSIREFTNEPVAIEDLKEMVRRAGLAPSMNNQQPWKFFVITNTELLQQMAKTVVQKIESLPSKASHYSQIVKSQVEMFATFFKDAPAVIAVCMQPYEGFLEKATQISAEELRQLQNYPGMQSAGAAIQNILLSAVDLGYGACWMNSPLTARQELEQVLGISEPFTLVSFIAIGKPVKESKAYNKRPLSDILEIRE